MGSDLYAEEFRDEIGRFRYMTLDGLIGFILQLESEIESKDNMMYDLMVKVATAEEKLRTYEIKNKSTGDRT